MCLLLLITRTLPLSSEVQVSPLSEVFSRIESEFNHFRSVIHNPRARAAAISAVGRKLNVAWKHLFSMRNALVPVSFLPPEVLARVFHFLSLEEPPYYGKRKLGWIRATHVCRLWRRVALDDSSLWAQISGIQRNTKLVSEMLTRSRKAPLDIDIDLGQMPNSDVLLMFPPHISHTRALCLHDPSRLHSSRIRSIFSRKAPALERLELIVSKNNPPIDFLNRDGTTWFKGRAPMLRTFSLHQVLIPWSLIPRGQLTHRK